MGLLDNFRLNINSFRKRYSRNSNAPRQQNQYGSGAYDFLRHHHSGKYSYDEYQDILKDTQVSVAMDTLTSFLLSKDYVLTSASDEPEDVEIYEFVKEMLDNMETPFRKVRKDLYTSMKYGYSALEKVYTINDDNRIVIKGLYGIHMKTLQNNPFIRDDDGELIGLHQQSVNGGVDIPIQKVLLSTFNAEFDEVQGNSLLNRVAEYPKLKDNIITWLVTFLHKHENPVTYAKIGSNTQFKDDILNMLDEISEGRTNMTIGADDELGTLESTHRGEAFFNALNYFDNLIFRGLFLGNLLLGDGGQTGSYSQSNVQLTVANNIFDGIHSDYSYDLQQVIDEIVHMNFGSNANSPLISFEKFTEKDLTGLLNALQPYANNMLIDTDSQWFKEVIAKIVKELADINVDTGTITSKEDAVDYGYQEPLPGETEVTTLVDNVLEGII